MSRVPQAAVRSVFRALMRHSRHVEADVGTAIKQQFRRRRAHAKVGHVRAAYELERQLRGVLEGTRTLADVRAAFSTRGGRHPPAGAPAAAPAPEKNSENRRTQWLRAPERLGDAVNPPPRAAQRADVHMRAQLANARAFFVQRQLRGFVPAADIDVSAVDTVFAPLWRAQRLAWSARRRAAREATPRQVLLKKLPRNSRVMHLLQTTGGGRQRLRGFRRHLARLETDFDARVADVGRRLDLARAAAAEEKAAGSREPLAALEEQWTAPLVAERAALVARQQNEYTRLEVQRRVLLRRREQLQRRQNMLHVLRQARRAQAALRAPPLRLNTL